MNKTIKANGRIVNCQIWDTAGQERYKSVTQAYYRGIQAAIVVFDITNLQSYQNIARWVKEL